MSAVIEAGIDHLLDELRPILIDLTACGYSVDTLRSVIHRQVINDMIRLATDHGYWPPARRH